MLIVSLEVYSIYNSISGDCGKKHRSVSPKTGDRSQWKWFTGSDWSDNSSQKSISGLKKAIAQHDRSRQHIMGANQQHEVG